MNINGENLRQIRDSKGWSQKEFAKFLGISERSYQNYEGGGAIPDAKKALIRSKLDANIAYKKTPLIEAGSVEEMLANSIYLKIKPYIEESTEVRKQAVRDMASIMQNMQHLMLDIDELKDHVEELKEYIERIESKVMKIPTE